MHDETHDYDPTHGVRHLHDTRRMGTAFGVQHWERFHRFFLCRVKEEVVRGDLSANEQG